MKTKGKIMVGSQEIKSSQMSLSVSLVLISVCQPDSSLSLQTTLLHMTNHDC